MGNGLPILAFKDLLLWGVAAVFGAAVVGAAHTYAGLMIKRWWYGGDRGNRRTTDSELDGSSLSMFHELLAVQKEFAKSNREVAQEIHASNQLVAQEIKGFTEAIEALTLAQDRKSNKAFSDHAEILSEVQRLDVPRKAWRTS